MKISEIGSVAIPQNAVNMKSRMHEKVSQSQEQSSNEVLTNPMETVGRSQVNFKSTRQLVKSLSAEELNIIAKYASKMWLSNKEVSVGKQALIDTMNKYKCKSVDEFAHKINKSLDSLKTDKPNNLSEVMLGDLEKNILKLDPSVNMYRASSIIDDFVVKNRGNSIS